MALAQTVARSVVPRPIRRLLPAAGQTGQHLRGLGMLARLTRDQVGFAHAPVTSESAAATMRRRLATRAERFLEFAERCVYGNAESPYLVLLRDAGCALDDLRELVQTEGLEGALHRLAAAGVYVTFDEFKGRTPIVRGSRRLAVAEKDFDSPGLIPHLEGRSGGTRSPGTRVKMVLPYLADLAVNNRVALDAHGLSEYDHALWVAMIHQPFIYAKLGRPPLAWFCPSLPLPTKLQVGARTWSGLTRLLGCPLPAAEYLDVQEPDRLVAWLAARRREGRSICVTTYASSAVRTAVAATEAGVSLEGVCFISIGEPFTDAKRRAVEASGARALVRYAFTEAGIIGFGCANATGPDDMHFQSDCFGLIQRTRPVGDSGLDVGAFMFTSLLPTSPKILLNVESGDTGILERRACGCPLEKLGLTEHISEVRSFEKLSGEGMTFIKSDLLRVLEEVLPERFGGRPSDYQVLEEEQDQGILRLLLLASPDLGPIDEDDLRRTFLDGVGRTGAFERRNASVWERAGTVEVRRERPVSTKAGKILPFHLMKLARPRF
jgi:hypothetical protein